jgi:FtsH-binding integral membrane protein
MTAPDSPDTRMALARRRFVRLMKLMFGASLLVTACAFLWFRASGVPTPLPFIGAIALAVIGSLMLAAALMGLVFFSAASGADDAVDKRDT